MLRAPQQWARFLLCKLMMLRTTGSLASLFIAIALSLGGGSSELQAGKKVRKDVKKSAEDRKKRAGDRKKSRKHRVTSKMVYHLLESQCKSHEHVTRDSFSS